MDITNQKMETIRKNQFISMVSHELKTPLTSLTGLLQLIKRRLKGQKDEHTDLEVSVHDQGSGIVENDRKHVFE